jgi:hypothetical protein
MRTTRTTMILTAAACLALTGGAAAASPAQVGPVTTVATAGDPAPFTVPGTGLKKGMELKPGQQLIAREVTLQGKAKATFKMTCRGTTRLRGLALDDLKASKVGFKTTKGNSYVGKKSVGVQAFAMKAAAGTEAKGSIYALCARP